MKIVLYKPFTGKDLKIKEKYDISRDICLRYTTKELKNWKNLDLYFILDLDSMRESYIPASVLKYVYQKKVLKYHPDGSRYPSEAFIAIQKAYKTLSDPVSRKKYDSVIFEDSIPEDREYNIDEFLSVFSEVFRKNSKFSKIQPVPDLGNTNSTNEEIENFYKFWQSFESWRSFEFFDEDDDMVMSFSERRALNKKYAEKWERQKNEDTLRIKNLVKMAIKRDPRITKKPKPGLKSYKEFANKGWSENDVELLMRLVDEIKISTKNRFDMIKKKFNEASPRKRQSIELFQKYREINKK